MLGPPSNSPPRWLFRREDFDAALSFCSASPCYAELEDDMCGMELPDHAAARELAAKVMQGLLRNEDEDWRGWTMEVRLDGRWVWHLPFDAIARATPH